MGSAWEESRLSRAISQTAFKSVFAICNRPEIHSGEYHFAIRDFEVLEKRINNFATRGIAKAENQTFKELFKERQILYKKYADITINCNVLTQDLAAEKIIKILNAI